MTTLRAALSALYPRQAADARLSAPRRPDHS